MLLRLAIARTHPDPRPALRAVAPEAEELRERFEAAALRPGTTAQHAREEAMFALDVQGDAKRAVELARLNLRLQREPVDLLVFARAASAAGDAAAREEARALMREIGLKDARVDAIP